MQRGVSHRRYRRRRDGPHDAQLRERGRRTALGIPGFTDELQIERDQLGALMRLGQAAHLLPSWNFMSIKRGPVIDGSMLTFGAKLGMALHFAETGRIVPPAGAVEVIWYSNVQAYSGNVPTEFIKMFGPGKTLRQGQREVADQFRASSIIATDGTLSAHIGVFRDSFAIIAFVAEDRTQLQHALKPVSPGFLKTGLEAMGGEGD